MGKQEEKEPMRTFIHGTDTGNAVLTALILIIAFSTVFVSLVPYIISTERFAHEYKTQIIYAIEQSNKEAIKLYDLY